MQPLLDSMGRGWYFVLLGLVSGVSGTLTVLLIKWKGMKWRQRRQQRGNGESQQAAAGEKDNV